MEKSLWLKNLTTAIEANTSIKPNIIRLLSVGNEEKVSHENSRGFSSLRLTAGKKKKKQFFSVWQQTRYWQCNCTKPFSGHHIQLLASFFHRGHLFDFPHKKQKPIIASILSSDTCIVMLQWPQKQVPASKERRANVTDSCFAPVQHRAYH